MFQNLFRNIKHYKGTNSSANLNHVPSKGFKLCFYFRQPNPYFKNEKLIKEYIIDLRPSEISKLNSGNKEHKLGEITQYFYCF